MISCFIVNRSGQLLPVLSENAVNVLKQRVLENVEEQENIPRTRDEFKYGYASQQSIRHSRSCPSFEKKRRGFDEPCRMSLSRNMRTNKQAAIPTTMEMEKGGCT